jgi:hypothetical protein
MRWFDEFAEQHALALSAEANPGRLSAQTYDDLVRAARSRSRLFL